MQRDAQVVARMDCLQSMAQIAVERRYVRPVVDDSLVIDIKQGRHPVIETLLPIGEEYIPNDVMLDCDKQQIIVITGPNMSGKSALLRQTVLIVLLAQMGSFVPAEAAHIGVVDKIFTRVGASDNISEGESTFMVEMLESASILNNISPRSLVLLDEIGRGTSTYDGISIAWAMVEYLHNNQQGRAKTLFATHYHELNELENMLERVKNYHVSVKEIDKSIVFLRALYVVAPSTRSVSTWLVWRACHEVLCSVPMISSPTSRRYTARARLSPARACRSAQSDVWQSRPPRALITYNSQCSRLDDPVLVAIRDQIKGLDINSLTPLEALNKLNEIKRITGL